MHDCLDEVHFVLYGARVIGLPRVCAIRDDVGPVHNQSGSTLPPFAVMKLK